MPSTHTLSSMSSRGVTTGCCCCCWSAETCLCPVYLVWPGPPAPHPPPSSAQVDTLGTKNKLWDWALSGGACSSLRRIFKILGSSFLSLQPELWAYVWLTKRRLSTYVCFVRTCHIWMQITRSKGCRSNFWFCPISFMSLHSHLQFFTCI